MGIGCIIRSTNNILLKCLDEREAKEMIIQMHEGVCGPHMNGHRLAKKRLRLGYYSCTMERDCIHFLQRCHKCQVHANLIYAPPTELHNQTTPWPFAVYCLDIIGRLTRRQPIGHEYILVAIDSFTKWDKNLLHHDHSGTRHNISEEAASHS